MDHNHNTTRRNFILSGAAAAIGGSALFTVSGCDMNKKNIQQKKFPKGSTILFQGDSITDMGRDRKNHNPNDLRALGAGYPSHISGHLLGQHPEQAYNIYNRGISGNKVFQLADRWQEDCIDIKPDILSILIGVNDIWHTLSGNYAEGSVEKYEKDYRDLLERTRKALPKARIIICEPFVLKVGAVTDEWFPEFDRYRVAAKKIADSFADTFVPFQAMFNRAAKEAPANYWLPDGVHPSISGAYLMAQEWLKYVL
ncbi:SGNH/GDSL hydrolase family protein [bacterium]|nr:SGNH/GDSL hydrolase family protein [bacterium]